MAEKEEEEEIELPKIVFSDDVDFEDFHTPEAPVQRKRPLSLRFSSEESSTKREDSPRKRSSIPYHQRIAGGTRVNESKNVLDDLMKPNAGKMINLAAIEEGKEELEDLENEIERRKENLMKGVAVQSTLRRRRVRRRRRKRNVNAFDGGDSGPHDHHLPIRQLSKFKLPALRDLKWNDIHYIARHLIKSHTFENIILVVVILNVIALCVQISLDESHDMALDILFWFQFLCLLFYTTEAFFKIVLEQCKYFRSGWDIMDFSIVLVDWIGVLLSGNGGFSAIRVHVSFFLSLSLSLVPTP